jgi:hypothetical protein
VRLDSLGALHYKVALPNNEECLNAREGAVMKRLPLFVFAILMIVGTLPVVAQENFTEGPISRIILIHIKPGRTTDFWADVRQNLRPVYEEYKKQGIIANYGFFTKATTESPEDWNVGIRLDYQNYAALDGLAARTDPITLKIYGSREARAAVATRRVENATTVSSFIIRQVDPRPMPSPAPKP